MDETELERRVTEELEKIKKNPHRYICDWMEGVLLHVGAKVFNYASLLPCSQILPNIPFSGGYIRAQQSMIILAPPSSGKSLLSRQMAKILINPISFRKISAGELRKQMLASEMFAIVNEDFTQVAEDYDVIKDLEGGLGDEQSVSAHNMRSSQEGKTKGVGFFCGTPSDLVRYMRNLEGGFFSRLNPTYINHTPEQHTEIGLFINTNIGESDKSEESLIKEKAVILFYKELRKIQSGENKDIPPIAFYDLPEDMKKQAHEKWKNLTEGIVNEIDAYWIRELHEFYRFLIAHTFLNSFNRSFKVKIEVIDGKEIKSSILRPTDADFKKAIDLMENNIKTKYYMLKATMVNGKIKDAEQLRKIMQSNVDPMVKNILMNINSHSAQLQKSDFQKKNTKNPAPPK